MPKEYSPLLSGAAIPPAPHQGGTPLTPTRKGATCATYLTADNKEHSFHVYKRDASSSSVGGTRPLADSSVKDQLKENEYAAANGLLRPEKTIDFFGSFALISNNISGPAMMGLPHLFHTAGVVPVVTAIAATFLGSSLVGTLMSDAIASIPGNVDFERNLSFSKAFHIILGPAWYALAEALFLVSCLVQACAAIVETAQSLDGFIASFVVGKVREWGDGWLCARVSSVICISLSRVWHRRGACRSCRRWPWWRGAARTATPPPPPPPSPHWRTACPSRTVGP